VLMPYRSGPVTTSREVWLCRTAAITLILLAAGLRFFYLAHDCPLDLSPDEAHYWDWSRHLDWSYYSKGPLVAWLIRLSCEFTGTMSVALTGNEMLAVRIPAILCGTLLLLSLYVLTVQVFGSDRLGLGIVAASLTMPLLAAGSTLMTIDAPYTCCWGWALVLAHSAIFRGSKWAWPPAGLVVALGILAKYNMIAFIPSVGLFLLTSREHRTLLLRPGFWIMSVIAALGLLPILAWNVGNNWVTFHHVHSISGQGNAIQWLGPLAYLGGQFALLLGVWFVAWVSAMIVHRPWKESDAGKRYLWWTSLPMFAVFLAFSIRTGGGELNWPATTYLSGMVLTAGWLTTRLSSPSRFTRRMTQGSLGFVCVLGILLTLLVHRSEWFRPILLSMSGPATEKQPLPLRRFDPSCRLRGWRTLAAEVDRIREQLHAEGIEPVLAATSWALPGEIGVYCYGHPTVYNIGLVQGDRHSQYDLWHPNPIDDPEQFRGRTFIIIGCIAPSVASSFQKIEQPKTVMYSENGQFISCWGVTICRGFTRLPPPKDGHY
jgi:Dolichyl-phosphate-mannose-protein mannosyltransferase